MTTEKEKQELLKSHCNALDAGATEIQASVKIEADKTVITVKDNGSGMNEKEIKNALKVLHQIRRDEIEDYYGILAGNSLMASGLNLVGMLVDDAVVESGSEGTVITVIRLHK